jgi:hypothetical protein
VGAERSSELLAAVRTAIEALRTAGARPVLYGGLAVGVRGRERYTKDVDVIADAAAPLYPAILRELAAHGARLPERAAERLDRDGMLPVEVGRVRVDLLVPADPLTESVARHASDEVFADMPVAVAQADDLIVMKLLAQRVQDVEDIKAMLVANRGRLDLARIRRWLPDLESYKPGTTELFERLMREFHDPL